MSNPLVSCVCPTRNRREWLPIAIECFLRQTYSPRELVIVADEESDVALIPVRSPRSKVLYLDLHPAIGMKRNCGNSVAAGEIIAHWDDDDFSFPTRLEDQVARLQETGKQVTGYHSMKFTNGSDWWQYRGASSWAFDTSLCYTREFWESCKFPPINDGLEYGFREQAIQRNVFISADAGEHMYATIHAANTSKHVLDDASLSWKRIERGVA